MKTNAEEPQLIKDQKPSRTYHLLPLEQLIETHEVPRLLPDAALMESIRRHGVRDPIFVVPAPPDELEGSYRYSVQDGMRRLTCVSKLLAETGDAEYESIPAILIRADSITQDILVLAGHATRHPNPLHEYEVCRRLMIQGFDEKAIQQQTGMPVGTIRKRLKLGNLTPELMEAWEDGRMAVSVAEAAAGLPPDRQQALLLAVPMDDRITARDVREARSAVREAAVEEAFEGLAPPASEPRPEYGVPLPSQYMEKLAEHLVASGFAARTQVVAEDEWIPIVIEHDNPPMRWRLGLVPYDVGS